MLLNATIRDMDGDEIGVVLEANFSGGKLDLVIDLELDDDEDEDEDDPDDGEEIDDDEDELDNTEEVPRPIPLRAVAGGRQ
jgi:hypothetical protein